MQEEQSLGSALANDCHIDTKAFLADRVQVSQPLHLRRAPSACRGSRWAFASGVTFGNPTPPVC
eukprot:3532206-Prorocentrum_lima.AAC.1